MHLHFGVAATAASFARPFQPHWTRQALFLEPATARSAKSTVPPTFPIRPDNCPSSCRAQMRCVGIGRGQILPNSCSAIDAACWSPSSLSTTLAFTELLTHDPWKGQLASGARSRLRRNCWPLVKRSLDGRNCGFRMSSWSRLAPDHLFKVDGSAAAWLQHQVSLATFQPGEDES